MFQNVVKVMTDDTDEFGSSSVIPKYFPSEDTVLLFKLHVAI